MAAAKTEQLTWKQVCEKLKADEVPGADGYNNKTLEYFRGVTPPIPIANIARRGKAHLFNYDQVLEWLAERRKNEKKSYNQTDRVNEANAIARKIMAEAQLKELELARLTAEVIPIAEARTAISEAITRARKRLLAIPIKCAPLVMSCETTAAAQEVIQDAIYEALAELARTEDDFRMDQ